MNTSTPIFALGCLMMLAPAISHSQTQCTFSEECFEGEACTDSSFELSYFVVPCDILLNPREIIVETEFGELIGREVRPSCITVQPINEGGEYVLTGDGATYILSVGDGNARLTTHVEGPMSITYIGQCEAPQ